MSRYLTYAVWLLSLISLFKDLAREMLYPVMQLYLQSIEFSIFFIGLLEGVANAVVGLSKGYFGQSSNHLGRRAECVIHAHAGDAGRAGVGVSGPHRGPAGRHKSWNVKYP